MPKISILTPTFNHERYIKFFLDSALKQTFRDFELIIVDDCSSDGTAKIIKKYKDKRIKFIQHPFNQGVNAVLNTAFHASKGQYLLLCAGDDILEPNALEVIGTAHDKNDIVTLYSPLIPIDSNNNVIYELMDGYCNMQCRSKQDFIYYTFMVANCFVSPGMSIKREYLQRIMPLNISLFNYQDYQMHIELLKFGEIGVLGERIIRYRVPTKYSNQASSPTEATAIREQLETPTFLDSYLAYDDIVFLEETFQKEIAFTGVKPYKDTLPFFFGYMALCSHMQRKIWGYHQIMKFYNKEGAQELLYKRYGFTFAHFLQLTRFFQQNAQ